ncbi:hypothetical protein ABZ471_36265 [Streptomyces sp. NPDC005728]|uniref:hypothetical protein n=1 Tax=Streptomyces sp. NPDC005728 TaxID=3157054 RepID=UPI003401C983
MRDPLSGRTWLLAPSFLDKAWPEGRPRVRVADGLGIDAAPDAIGLRLLLPSARGGHGQPRTLSMTSALPPTRAAGPGCPPQR